VSQRNLPINLSVDKFDFVNEDTLYVGCTDGGSFYLYKSFDGGFNWIDTNFPITSGQNVQSIVFTTSQNGAVVLDDIMYRTIDGGNSWYYVSEFGFNVPTFFATKNNQGQILSAEVNFGGPFRILLHEHNALYFSELDMYDADGNILSFGRSDGDNMYFFKPCSQNDIFGYNYVNQTSFTLENVGGNCYSPAHDVVDTQKGKLVVRGGAELLYYNVSDTYVDFNDEFGNTNHDNDFLSVETFGSYSIAVGESMFVTDKKGPWHSVFDQSGNALTNKFTFIRKISGDDFFLSGENGLFYRGKIE